MYGFSEGERVVLHGAAGTGVPTARDDVVSIKVDYLIDCLRCGYGRLPEMMHG